MFDIGWDEMLLTAIVAIIVIGPKDLPMALRTAGRWVGKVRRVSGYFRSGIETMIRDAELEEMEQRWKEQNAAIMSAHPPAASAEAALVGEDPGTGTANPPAAFAAKPEPTETVAPEPAKTKVAKPKALRPTPAAPAPAKPKRAKSRPATEH